MRTIADNGIGITIASGGQDGRGMSFTDSGEFTYRLTFTDGSSGVFISFMPVPEPGTIGLAAAGLMLVGWLRRRAVVKRTTPPPRT